MSRRWVYCFQPRFQELVASGAKRQTIRGRRKDGLSPAPGDVLSLRAWVGKPRASKQRLLRPECQCVASYRITINEHGHAWVDPKAEAWNLHKLAKADGFSDWPDMLAWFRENHGLPFTGRMIQW